MIEKLVLNGRYFLFYFACICLGSMQSAESKGGILSFTLENDLIVSQDDGYTNGLRLGWMSHRQSPEWAEMLAKWLPFYEEYGRLRYGFSLGQSIFTPANIASNVLQKNDRPYAGWAYVSAGLLADMWNQYDFIQLSLGVIGPKSYAEPAQKFVHKIIQSPEPQGWQHQLGSELGIGVSYERKWRQTNAINDSLSYQFLPHIGFSLGNVHTHASLGMTAKFGHQVDSDYGPPVIQPGMSGSDFFEPTDDLGWYLFFGAEACAVLHNIFLDGNTFKSGHSVDKIPLTATLHSGFAFTYGRARLAYTHMVRSPEFEEQDEWENYGSISLSVSF